MSLTETEQVFAGVTEDAVNDLMIAIFTARPRYLIYGSPLFAPATTASVTQVPAIPFPGVSGGIHYAVVFTIPKVDFHPDDSGGASPLPPGLGQFTLTTTVIRRILEHLGLWAPLATERSPPLGPANWPRHASLPLTYHPVPDIA
jgi:hypothetical protein